MNDDEKYSLYKATTFFVVAAVALFCIVMDYSFNGGRLWTLF